LQKHLRREIYYHIHAGKLKEVADFIEPFRKMWDDRFNKLEACHSLDWHTPKRAPASFAVLFPEADI
jgi:hypothetical protein